MYPVVEWRKLHKNMTKWEGKRINELIHNNEFRFNEYSRGRLEEREISEADVYKTIKYGEVIEFHYKYYSPRVLIRGKEIVNGESVCVVLDLKLHLVVTVYKNDVTDKHSGLHKELYCCRDIMKFLNVG